MRPRFQVVLPLLLLVSTLASAQNFTFKDTDYPVGPDPLSIKSGDLIGDGKSDLVIVNSASNRISVLRHNGNGTFATALEFATGAKPAHLALTDLNTDGKLDSRR